MKTLTLNHLFFIPALLASQIASASVVLLEDSRSVTGATPPTPFSSWAVDLQNSQITTSSMSGSGHGYSTYSTFSSTYFIADSYFGVRFLVEQAQTLQLDATLTTYGSSNCGSCSMSGFSLIGPAGFSTISGMAQISATSAAGNFTYYGSPNRSIAALIDLAPGVYTLSFGTSNYGYSLGSAWSFSAQFPATVPLPATGWMLISALGSLGAARKLHTRN